jgi:outer membrane lipoprotein-sorting protein
MARSKELKFMKKLISMMLLSLAITATGAHGKEKLDPENWIRDMEEAYAKIDNYTAIFHKQERVSGKLLEEETIFIKFKKPFKVYMKWIKDPYKGRQILYVENWNENQMKVRERGILGVITVNLDPNSSMANKGNRHPITESGLGHLVKLIEENLRKGAKVAELKFIGHGEETVYGHKTKKVELIFPKDEARGYYCYHAIINIDVEKKLPLKVQIYDWEDNLIEKYGYEELKLDPGLTDADFDPKNRDYKF